MKTTSVYILATILIISALFHLIAPDLFAAIIPEFIPVVLANVLAAIAEFAIGMALFLPKYRRWGGLGFSLLMFGFLPLHIWDVFRETPAMGSQIGAIIRLLVQFWFIYMGWWIHKSWKLT